MARQVYLCQQADICHSSIENYIKEIHSKCVESVQFVSPASTETSVVPTAALSPPTLGEYATALCRNHNLFPSSRVSVLSEGDCLQVLQLCLAHRNKERGEAFDVDASKVFEYRWKIAAVRLSTGELSSSPNSVELLQEYNNFLSASGHVDLTDVCTAVQKGLSASGLTDVTAHGLTDVTARGLMDVSAVTRTEQQDEGSEQRKSDLQKELETTVLVLLGVPESRIEKFLIKQLCRESKVIELHCDEISEDSRHFTEQPKNLDELLPLVANTPEKNGSQKFVSNQQVFVSKVLLAYLHILVNSRSELALARIFNTPDRELDHRSFTALRHQATKTGMSMYQTATSFLMKIRLGGQSYAPSVDHPLNRDVKGLGDLIELIQRLQTVAEEEPDTRSACRRMLAIVRNKLIKCRQLKLVKQEVEAATEQLYSCIAAVMDNMEATAGHSPDKPASEGGSMVGRKCLRVIQLLLDKMAAAESGDNCDQMFLNDIALNPTTPSRVPSLLSQFRSPDVVPIEEDSPLGCEKPGLQDKTNITKYQNSEVVLPGGEKMTRKQLREIIVIPSKTIAHASSNSENGIRGLKPAKRTTCAALDKENLCTRSPTESEKPAKKRKIADKVVKVTEDAEVCPSQTLEPKELKKKAQTAKKGCRRRLMPQVKGQQKLTGFFRV